MIISLIVAMDERGGIGKENHLPWHLPADLKRFKKLTMGHYIVMGRKTYETIGRPLPGRKMIIVTHRKDYFPEDCLVVDSLWTAINVAEVNQESELLIIGGGEIFSQAIGLANKIYLTIVRTDVNADVFFPKIDPSEWEIMQIENHFIDVEEDFRSDFKILQRLH